jgi:FtsZ-binding cell division protein ZapB
MKDYEYSELYETMNPGTLAKKINELEDKNMQLREEINGIKEILRDLLQHMEDTYKNYYGPGQHDHRLFCNQD